MKITINLSLSLFLSFGIVARQQRKEKETVVGPTGIDQVEVEKWFEETEKVCHRRGARGALG